MSENTTPLLSPETGAACEKRLQRLRERLPEHAIDGLLVNNEKDILYLSGFVGHDSVLLVTADDAVIISDPRYDEYLDPWRRAGHVQIVMGMRHRLHEAIRELCGGRSVGRLGFQADCMTVATEATFAGALGDTAFVPTTGVLSTLRMIKDALEISRIEAAVAMQQEALQATLPELHIGMTEMQFNARLEFEMHQAGAFGASFDAIIGAGSNSSIIHHQTSATSIQPGTLLVDWGAVTPDGYCSDQTRTFGVGHLTPEMIEIYGIVLEAQVAAVEACAPGRICADIDAVARKIITDAGHGEHFGHGLGHGLGLDVHEAPYFNDLQTDIDLQPGMVMTVEPGIYLPGVGGVRIEDDVLITESGYRVLTSWPKGPDTVVVEPGAAIVS